MYVNNLLHICQSFIFVSLDIWCPFLFYHFIFDNVKFYINISVI